MLRVLLVDDEMLARDELKYLLYRTKQVDIVDEAESVEEALDHMVDHKPDLVFLDIELSDDNGFDIATRLKRMKNPPAIIFATAYDSYALKAFEVDAIDYILKPFEEERVVQAINKFLKLRMSETLESTEHQTIAEMPGSAQKLAIHVDESIVLVNLDSVVYTGLEDGKVTIKTLTEKYMANETLVVLEKKLPPAFVRVHRGFIVNPNLISEVQPWFNSTYNIIMKDGSKIPVSRTYVKDLKKLLGI